MIVCCGVLQRVAVCSALQYVVVCCSVLQCLTDEEIDHSALAALGMLYIEVYTACCSVLQWYVAVCCSVLQCLAVSCSLLQCVAV